ncbi:hypothetical protein AX17_003682 [Amanita inopinata Kibby_2008]|nr:hypothetical protein AX17_003682 [Amanita inopinata Kibby_2008]
MLYRLLFAFIVLFASLCTSLAVPVPATNETVVGTTEDLEKRLTHVGRGTWFHVGLGNCGNWNVDSDHIVAIPKSLYDHNGGHNCGQWIEIVNVRNGKKAFGLTRDSCPSCGSGDLDMSPSLFSVLDSLDVGVLKISWHFMNKAWKP